MRYKNRKKLEWAAYESQGAAIRRIMHGISEDSPEESEENINITEDKVTLSPKIIQLLRMGLADKGELETVKRALRSGEKALNNPILRRHLLELLNKLVDAIEDDSQIWVRLRKRLLKGDE
jgi:hypothetical protein